MYLKVAGAILPRSPVRRRPLVL